MTHQAKLSGPPLLQGARDRSGDRLRYHLTRGAGQLLRAAALPQALASAAVVIACHIAIAAMTGWTEAQAAVLNPPPHQERQS